MVEVIDSELVEIRDRELKQTKMYGHPKDRTGRVTTGCPISDKRLEKSLGVDIDGYA